MTTKQMRISLNKQDAEYLKAIAKKLGIRETDVLRQGLKLMSVCAESSNPSRPKLIVTKDNKEEEILVAL